MGKTKDLKEKPTREIPENKRICFKSILKSIDRVNKTIDVIMTTSQEDRDGDIIDSRTLVVGPNFFPKNPVVLWAHNSWETPIAKVIKINQKVKQVEATVQFADTKKANEVFELYAGGFLHAWSIGFFPSKDPGDTVVRRAEPDEGGYQRFLGFLFKNAELVELSSVPVPSNPGALVRQLSALKGKHPKLALSLMKDFNIKDGDLEGVDEIDETLSDDLEEDVLQSEFFFQGDKAFLTEQMYKAMKKSLVEKGAAGKIPVNVAFVKTTDQTGANYDYEILKGTPENPKEIKLICITLYVLDPKSKSLEESRSDEDESTPDSNEEEPQNPVIQHSLEMELEKAELGQSELDQQILNMEI